MTIIDAIKEVMRIENRPLSVQEAYRFIEKYNLYEFHSENPAHIVRSQIRRHCDGLDFPSASKTKHFELFDDGKFFFLKPHHKPNELSPKEEVVKPHPPQKILHDASSPTNLLDEIQRMHSLHKDAVKMKTLNSLKEISPSSFENFAKKLLTVYGFYDMVVTSVSNDGGIDGHGRLKVGLAYMNIAFQCKRWKKNNIGRPEVDKFRGAIQGKYEQGIFFTTSTFTKSSQDVSIRPGAVPIILVDGTSIVDLMIEKKFGILMDNLPIYSYALDLILAEDNGKFSN
jgi:restriction system protein